MKNALHKKILVLLAVISSLTTVRSEEVFHVSKVGNEKTELIAVFKAIQQIEKKKTYGYPRSFEVLQKLDSKGYLVYRTRTEYSTIASGMASIGGGGGAYTTSREVTDHSKIYFLVLSEPKDYADGDRLKDIFAVDNSKTKSYTNTLGATQTVTVLDEVTPVDLSQDEFVEKLKKGESWLLKRFKEKSCTSCFGDGKLSATTNYAKCPDCKGKGSTLLDCVIKW